MLSLSVFRDAIRKLTLRKKLTILASVSVLLPILILTYMQYGSLSELQNKTKGAFKDNLRQGFTGSNAIPGTTHPNRDVYAGVWVFENARPPFVEKT